MPEADADTKMAAKMNRDFILMDKPNQVEFKTEVVISLGIRWAFIH